jgi:hypothetical protein
MKTYTLVFTAINKQLSISINAEVIYGKTSLSYKTLVDMEISKWLRLNKLTAKSTKVLDIVLLNESKQQVFNQGDWSEYTSIIQVDFNEDTNSDLIGINNNGNDEFDLNSLE